MLPAVDDSPLECIVWILKTIFSVIIETHCPIVGRKSYLANSLFKLNKQNVLAENLKRCNFKEAKICSIPDPSYCFFFKMGQSRPLFLYFRHFNAQLTVNKCSIYIYINFCRWLDSNYGPLVSEATALQTEPLPLPYKSIFASSSWLFLWRNTEFWAVVILDFVIIVIRGNRLANASSIFIKEVLNILFHF